jgi:hypothetical protein
MSRPTGNAPAGHSVTKRLCLDWPVSSEPVSRNLSGIVAIGWYALLKINAAGAWIDRTETTAMNEHFERMSAQKLEAYAQTGALPEWFKAKVEVADSLPLPTRHPAAT